MDYKKLHPKMSQHRTHEYKCMDGMIDNRRVHDLHREGIGRVTQRKRNPMDVAGHNGKMGMRKDKAHWSRQGDSLTPRKA